jgi:hypothetical protein
MSVIIGVDPHKATHTAVAIDPSQAELSACITQVAARPERVVT